jgi:hypothetical protein
VHDRNDFVGGYGLEDLDVLEFLCRGGSLNWLVFVCLSGVRNAEQRKWRNRADKHEPAERTT